VVFIPVHMHERLSASTEVSPLSPDVARDEEGWESSRGHVCRAVVLFADCCGSAAEGVDCESLRFTPSTNARKRYLGGEAGCPLGTESLAGTPSVETTRSSGGIKGAVLLNNFVF